MTITKSNKHEVSLDHDKPNEKGGCTLCYSWSSLMRSLFGFSNLNHHLLIRLVTVKWEFVLVTLGDRHHLDGLVVIGSLVIIRRSLWITQLKLWAVVGDSPRRSVEESTCREHLILARIKGELHPCSGAPTRTSGEWRLSDTLAKHHRVPPSLFTLSIYFEQFNSCLYIYRIAMLE